MMIASYALGVERRGAVLLARYSPTLLRLSMGMIFLGFGALKFFPGLSPAEDIALATFELLTLGLVPAATALLLVAGLESTIGILLLTGWLPRVTLGLLAAQMAGVLSPLVLLPGRLFDGPFGVPTLEGQYVLKDVILLAASFVIAADMLRARVEPTALAEQNAQPRLTEPE